MGVIRIPRIISGTAKGLQIETPKGVNTRPTTDRVKESLFNIINHLIDGSVVLDLFSGSGSLGIEALSRGAFEVVFCDKDSLTTQLIKKNIEHCKLTEKSEVLCCDYKQAIKKLAQKKINIVFLDPPYGTGILQDSIKRIIEENILTKDAIIVAEHSKGEVNILPDVHLDQQLLCKSYGDFEIVRKEKYGDICISFIKRRLES